MSDMVIDPRELLISKALITLQIQKKSAVSMLTD